MLPSLKNSLILVAIVSSLLLLGCNAQMTPEPTPSVPLDQMPISLAQPLFQAGYNLIGYYELDANDDGLTESLAVLSVNLPLEQSFVGDTYVMLFSQRGGAWSTTDNQRIDGINAHAELRDMNGDGFPELLIFTEKADSQMGDFITPLHYADYLFVFTYQPDQALVNLRTFNSALAGVLRPRTEVVEWEGRPAVRTVRDIGVGGAFLQPYRVETFAWDDKEGFVSVQVQEHKRVSSAVSWLARRNAPWAAAAFVLGGVLGLLVSVLARRLHRQERWFILGLGLLLVGGGVGVGLAREWLCSPALILVGLAGLGLGWRMTTRVQ